MSQLPLPEGWIQEYDPQQKHPFWVDTKAKPPRAIWVHPYEDEQFLSENPDIKAKVEKLQGATLAEPPPYEQRRHSFSGGEPDVVPFRSDAKSSKEKKSSNNAKASGSASTPSIDEHHDDERKRGMFGKLKDKAIGTKEEREAHKKLKAEERAREEEQREAHRKLRAEQRAREEEQLREARRRNLEERAAYMQQHGGNVPYGGYGGYSGAGYSGYSQYGPPAGDPYAYNNRRRTGGGGLGGGMALPLLGGLAGGLLLGDMLSGGFDGGFGGGGGFDGGFGGGGFF
ncbi:uncharacterized protein EDB91DRAFT_1109992 [Suillus paluster]|uniref:uncharacterized protein n=1 Tax=Suillus paluster TaxID=48578 RepID=UPI001B877733|nr:uncharacterized protein EDB91DRAFT_1109992 [Suillus paluster]KAG1749854.1 hypothetical protein EDB91DRAFT_1109992 [Suillus paluster]